MVSSLITKFSTIVMLVPLGSSSAAALLPVVIKTISDIESCNLYVDPVCTDNYTLNVSLYKLLSPNNKTLIPEVVRPCDPNRYPIYFLILSIYTNLPKVFVQAQISFHIFSHLSIYQIKYTLNEVSTE